MGVSFLWAQARRRIGNKSANRKRKPKLCTWGRLTGNGRRLLLIYLFLAERPSTCFLLEVVAVTSFFWEVVAVNFLLLYGTQRCERRLRVFLCGTSGRSSDVGKWLDSSSLGVEFRGGVGFGRPAAVEARRQQHACDSRNV